MLDTFNANEPVFYLIMYMQIIIMAAFIQPLPTGDFKWIEDVEYFKNIIKSGSKVYTTNKKCSIEVYLEYPQEFHLAHADLLVLN